MAARVSPMREVSYAFVDSPFGDLLVAGGERGIVRVAFPEEDPPYVLEELAAGLEAEIRERRRALDPARREIAEYFGRRRRRFGVRADLSGLRGFNREVLRETARIPYGQVATYGDVAAAAGAPRGGRAAGNALRRNPIPLFVPCHRVVLAGGGIGGYGGHEDRKAFLLALETGP